MQIRSESMLAQHAEKAMQLLQRADGGSESSISKVTGGNPFAELMTGGVAKVNDMRMSADSQMEQLITGGDVNQAEVFTSMQKADMSFRLLVQIRNKLMDAYQEINSIHV